MAKNSSSNRADQLVKLVLVVFVSLLSFSVGTYVGKQFSDSEYRKAQLEDTYGNTQRTTAATDEAVEPGNEGITMSDEEISSLTEEFMDEERKAASEGAPTEVAEAAPTEHTGPGEYVTPAQHPPSEKYAPVGKKPETAAAPAAPTSEHHPAPVPTAAARVAAGQAPTADAKPREVARALPGLASSTVGKYTVQIASYSTADEAKTHAANLTSKGYSAFFVPAEIKGKTWYRVRVGVFPTQDAAVQFQKELKAQAGIAKSIVQRMAE